MKAPRTLEQTTPHALPVNARLGEVLQEVFPQESVPTRAMVKWPGMRRSEAQTIAFLLYKNTITAQQLQLGLIFGPSCGKAGFNKHIKRMEDSCQRLFEAFRKSTRTNQQSNVTHTLETLWSINIFLRFCPEPLFTASTYYPSIKPPASWDTPTWNISPRRFKKQSSWE